jgi:hypothetical protein
MEPYQQAVHQQKTDRRKTCRPPLRRKTRVLPLLSFPTDFNSVENDFSSLKNRIRPRDRQAFLLRFSANSGKIEKLPHGFKTKPYGYGLKPYGYDLKPYGYGLKPYGFDLKPYGYGLKPYGYDLKPYGYDLKPYDFVLKPCGDFLYFFVLTENRKESSA